MTKVVGAGPTTTSTAGAPVGSGPTVATHGLPAADSGGGSVDGVDVVVGLADDDDDDDELSFFLITLKPTINNTTAAAIPIALKSRLRLFALRCACSAAATRAWRPSFWR